MKIEYIEQEHWYLVDGAPVPSITEMLKFKFPKKYEGINKKVLKNASVRGTAVHENIQNYCCGLPHEETTELINFKTLQDLYNFKVASCEEIVHLSYNGEVIACGRYDLSLIMDGAVGGADIKTTSTLDKEYLCWQLNLYRLAVRETFGIDWQFLKGIWLRNDKMKFVDVPLCEKETIEFIEEYKENSYE